MKKTELLKVIDEDLTYWKKKLKYEVNDNVVNHLKGRIDYLIDLKNVSDFTKNELLNFLTSSFADIKIQYKDTKLNNFKSYLQGKISVIERYAGLIEENVI